jgi:hypothetical protein
MLDEKGRVIEKGQDKSHTQNICHYCAENRENVFEIMIKATDQGRQQGGEKIQKREFRQKMKRKMPTKASTSIGIVFF